MFRQVERFREFLGEGRFWMLVGLLATTGIASFVLTLSGTRRAVAAQTLLALGGILGALVIIGSRMNWSQRLKGLAVLAPAFGLVALGMLFVPQYQAVFFGAALGWLVVGLMTFQRSRGPMQYQEAVKHMRKREYKEAVAVLDTLIKAEPDDPSHYRLRGRILRLWGKIGRARRDYEAMIEYSKNDGLRAEAYNELAELELQARNYDKALEAAQQAFDLLPNDWIAAYNLGMIQDRLGQSEDVVDSLHKALDNTVPDARHRLLIYLWLARAYARLGQADTAREAVRKLGAERRSLSEWRKLLDAEEAAVLRDVLALDVELAGKLIAGEVDAMQLAGEPVS